ncbi:LacI family DNA-binding transcriptional regulator [Granulicella cerasi]|uniref:LacI family DNA-binding transcriptional regulator n=1 Tax=Granulicella cerasi TaxID=741063 RepID=A0ABW1Z8X7_9BACT|nr:LacI family DNA-binding transcriptional regulator [Granulicella cerasi]
MDILAVAKRAGVSSATVSRVLNYPQKVREETAQRVRDAIRELEYIPNNSARSLRSGRSNVYGLIVSDIRNPFFPDLIEQFEALATEHGIDVTFANSGYSEDRMLASVRRLLERNVAAVAVLTSEVSEAAIQRIRDARIPAVFLNQPVLLGDVHNITVDYLNGLKEAVDHLLMLGHKRIGFVAGPPTLSSAARRRQAFVEALRLGGLKANERFIFEGDHKMTGGQAAAESIFSMKQRPTAVICSNDMTAVGLLHATQRLGYSVPKDLSVVGFDDLIFSEIVQPALTTLHLSRLDIATRAFFALHHGRDANASAQTEVILPRLVVRDSTARITS